MKTEPQHTPTPWAYHLGRGKSPRFHIQTTAGYQIASTPELDSLSKQENEAREKDAAFIVLAVNSHDELLDICRYLIAADNGRKNNPSDFRNEVAEIIAAARQAIAKAEGK